jgi:general secretion pathway protein K
MMLSRQRGVAVVTALLLATLAITIVASLFWQQQVQVRSIENQRFQLQKKWVLRGALDWARLILREDARTSNEVDHLGEPWAVTLGETQLDQYVDNGKSDTEASEASLSGKIADAQAKFNLNNLALNGVTVVHQVEIFERLLSNLNLDPGLAKTAATTIADTQNKAVEQHGEENNVTTRVDTTPNVKFLRFSQIDDLLAVSGFTPKIIYRLKEFVTVLPGKTRLNVNTTSAEVLAAYLDGASLSDAALIIAIRDRAYFRDLTDFKSRVTLKKPDFQDTDVSFSTNFFIINGKVKLSRSTLEINALLERTGITTKVLWVKEV